MKIRRFVEAYASREATLAALAERLSALASDAVATGGRFIVAMGGGRTPVTLNGLLVQRARETGFDWSRTQIYLTDERCVPPTHPDSTAGMIRRTLLDPLGVAPTILRPMFLGGDPEADALAYEEQLRALQDERQTAFDLVLLGAGPDGHVASLFPGCEALDERKRLCVAAGPGPDAHQRITLTYPAMRSSGAVWVVVCGREKEAAFRSAIDGTSAPRAMPLAGVASARGDVVFWTDERGG